MKQGITERSDQMARSTFAGGQAVVVGSGIAGLAAAGALSGWFERVTVLERDHLPAGAAHRPGTPQDRHAHGILAGGLFALEELFPGLGEDLARAGAVPLRINQDLREEWPGRDPTPQRDFGLRGYTMSRPLIEHVLRERLARRTNVAFRQNVRALRAVADAAGRRVAAVECAAAAEAAEGDRRDMLPADLVVDASGRGQLTVDLLQSVGRPRPHETTIGFDLRYTTAIVDIPGDAPTDWKVVVTHCDTPHSTRRALILPIENNRWIMTVAGRGDDAPPGEWNELLAYLRQLPTSTIHDAVRTANPAGKPVRFGFAGSVWRHFEQVGDFPDGLIPVGDAICRFSPVYGQGMTVAAKEAVLLSRVIEARARRRGAAGAGGGPLAGLGRDFLAEASGLIETPWMMAALPDFAFPDTVGVRPPNLEHSLRFAEALSRLAARDGAVQRRFVEVWHMLKPRSVLQEPDLVRRVEAEMAGMAAA